MNSRYYIACGVISHANLKFNYTLNEIMKYYDWDEAHSLKEIYTVEEAYNIFLKSAASLKTKLVTLVLPDETICNLPYMFLMKGNKTIAVAAQQIINGKFQEVEINWYVE